MTPSTLAPFSFCIRRQLEIFVQSIFHIKVKGKKNKANLLTIMERKLQ